MSRSRPTPQHTRPVTRRPSRSSVTDTVCYAPQIVKTLAKCLNSDISVQFLSALETGDWKALVSLEVDPSTYTNAEDFKRDYLLCEIMSKYPLWDIGVDRTVAALSKFIDSEISCAAVNDTFDIRARQTLDGLSAASVLLTARRKISRVLGDFDITELEQCFEWGPGASVTLRKRYSDAYYKFGEKPSASYNMATIAGVLKEWHKDGLWSFDPQFVAGSHGTTVPKNAKTDRFIAIEPDLNLYVQKGIGKMMRRRLHRIGLLKPDAQSVNSALARQGSLDDSLATLDLSAASDTISSRLVEELLPKDWSLWIEQSRSPVCVLPSLGLSVQLEKVSSMGNGFTFELETLIFWALASSVASLVGENGYQCVAYGDDIICPSRAAQHICNFLQLFGFTINRKKTHISGPFRESCGKHWFNGIDVTPFYVRDKVLTRDRIYWFANSIREWASEGSICDPTVKPAYDHALSFIPDEHILPVPASFGKAAGLILDQVEAIQFKSVRFSRKTWSFSFRYLSTKTLYRYPEDIRRYCKSLYALERKWGRNGADDPDTTWRPLSSPTCEKSRRIGRVPRGSVTSVSTASVSGWDGYGIWA